jgi:hypothetical protein
MSQTSERQQRHDQRVFRSLDDVTAFVAECQHELYVRFGGDPKEDAARGSIDYESGLQLPGLSVNPLHPPSWWRNRPLRDWVRRQACAYHHLKQQHPDRRCWIVGGAVVERGPDNEPLLDDVEVFGAVADDALEECRSRDPQAARDEDEPEADGSAAWHSGS